MPQASDGKRRRATLARKTCDIPGFLLLAGGLPVKEGDEEVIGAIGIGGAPGGHLDEACAQAAIDGLKK